MTGVSLIPIRLWVAALACAGTAIWRQPRPILRGASPSPRLALERTCGPDRRAIYAAFRGFEARLAVGIAAACFLIGAGIGYIRDIVAQGNLAPGNAGPIMVTDSLTPIAILMLLAFASEKWRPKSPATVALVAELEVARKALREYRQALSEFGK